MGFYEKLLSVTAEVIRDEPMRERTTFKAGGAAAFFVAPKDRGEALAVVRLCKGEGVRLLPFGGGSNLLFRDGGFDGVVMSMGGLNTIEALDDGVSVRAGAGVTLKDLTAFCAERGLAGIEFACGIPGTIGGAAYMNAGAYDAEVADVFYGMEAIDQNKNGSQGGFVTVTKGEMDFGYRKSLARALGLIIVSVTLKLSRGDGGAIKKRIYELNERRAEKQPLDDASAGSTFKRPKGYFAGKLIMDSGLAGYGIGGAQVSQKHCGFVINKGGASAADISKLIAHIQKTVYDKFGAALEPEVVIVGEW